MVSVEGFWSVVYVRGDDGDDAYGRHGLLHLACSTDVGGRS